ncbi:MAG: transporter, family, hexuronate transporter [Pyrinomonadaceae bacterium]|jgi:ACS family hexuronate transporter-like MFS transporter|nr:transporter, family, hexuronate transporter [Pyrinomonadaceae bacterium]
MREKIVETERVASFPKSLSVVAPPSSPTPANGTGGAAAVLENVNARIGRYRWTICALLFFAATINYVDRQVIGILKPTLKTELGWDEIAYSNIVFWFQAAYALGFILMGRLMDRFGTRKGFSFAVLFWSFAAMAHAFASSVMGFGAARFALGLGESGNFPASIKTVAEWFPKKERALATGIFNAGTNVGAIVTPLSVPWIAGHLGWRWAFIITGALGFIWVVAWLALYRKPLEHPRVKKPELDHINCDPPEAETKIPWLRLLPHRQTWAFAVAKFMTDPVWWFYLFWIPGFLHDQYHVPADSITSFGLPLVVIYLAADIGSVGGGWLSSTLIKRGWTINAARKTAMLICAVCVVPIVFVSQTANIWVAVALIGLAASAHQGWSANVFTMTSDLFPRRAVGSVVGIGGMAGAVGGMLIAKVVGYVLQWTGSYLPIFIIAGSAYLTALLVVHLLVPRFTPARVDQQGAA